MRQVDVPAAPHLPEIMETERKERARARTLHPAVCLPPKHGATVADTKVMPASGPQPSVIVADELGAIEIPSPDQVATTKIPVLRGPLATGSRTDLAPIATTRLPVMEYPLFEAPIRIESLDPDDYRTTTRLPIADKLALAAAPARPETRSDRRDLLAAMVVLVAMAVAVLAFAS